MDVVTYPAEVLQQEAEIIEEFDGDLRELASEMLQTMYASRGVGLAAPQVGISRRLIVINPAAEPEAGEEIALVNPEIVATGKETDEGEEGCLSVPGVTGNVRRFSKITVTGVTLSGEPVEREVDGFLARIFQHEIDHLDGILFITKLSPVDRAAAKQKLRDMKAKAR